MPHHTIYNVIACSVFRPEYEHIRAALPDESIKHDVTWLELGLHRDPAYLNSLIRDEITAVDNSGKSYDAILLLYGLCSHSIVGLTSNSHRLVLARAHDCITLFLGSKDRYREEFDKAPGTYWFTRGFIGEMEHTGFSETYEGIYREYEKQYETYLERFGDPELARHVIEHQEQGWVANYTRGALVESGLINNEHLNETARSYCQHRGWEFARVTGDLTLIRDLLMGEWDDDRYLIVQPGEHIIAGTSCEIVTVEGLPESPPTGNGIRRYAFRYDGKYETCEFDEAEHIIDAVDTVIGIDAGGTCTDAVVVSLREKRVRASAKSPTTHGDLAIGIERALRQLPDEMLACAERLSISTTLATNAIVEGKGSRTGLILIGYPPATAALVRIGGGDRKLNIGGSHNIDGDEREPLDEMALARAVGILIADNVEALAVSSFMATRNPAHEQRAMEFIAAQTGDIPAVAGHTLTDDLDAVRRAHTTLLNARLTPVVEHLIDAVTAIADRLGLPEDIRFVTADGTLMNSREARKQPVRMVLSGPAASVMGVRLLTGSNSAVIADMGGTTTDIAIIEHGAVRRSGLGATVGDYRTSVRAADMRTIGLGGDSWIRFNNGNFTVGPRRVMPISQLAAFVHAVYERLTALSENPVVDQELVQPGTFYLLQGEPKSSSFFTESELAALEIIAEGPVAEYDLAIRLGALHPSLLGLSRLENLGIILRSGLTPTDLMIIESSNVDGFGGSGAAALLLGMYAACAGLPREDCVRSIWQKIHRMAASGIITEVIGQNDLEPQFPGCQYCEQIFNQHAGIEVTYRLKWPLVGIGAPAKHMLRGMERYLTAELVFPEHGAVANAAGAAACSGGTHIDMRIAQSDRGGFHLHAPDGRHVFGTLEGAKQHAVMLCRELAQSYALEMGYIQFSLTVTIEDRSAPISSGSPLYIDTVITAVMRY